MSLAEEVRALRSSAGLSRAPHIAVVHVDGDDALDFLQGLTTQTPYIRVGRVRHTLFLRDDASLFADAFVVNLGDGFLVFAEGPDESSMVDWLERMKDASPGKRVSIRGMDAETLLFSVDGPYAWEVVAGLLGPAALGMPYLTLMAQRELMCLRAGKTGEYGYLLLVPRDEAATVEARLCDIGAAVDLAHVGLEALDTCALESWHFTMRMLPATELASRLTPLELQLQWRVTATREFVGAAALRARLAEGVKARATCFTADAPVVAGQRLRLDEIEVGQVLAACHSPTLGRTVGAALLREPFFHPHLSLSAVAAQSSVPIRTQTASLVLAESLRVKPHVGQGYATRGQS